MTPKPPHITRVATHELDIEASIIRCGVVVSVTIHPRTGGVVAATVHETDPAYPMLLKAARECIAS